MTSVMTKTEYKLFKIQQHIVLFEPNVVYIVSENQIFTHILLREGVNIFGPYCPHNGSYESIMAAMQICRLELIGKQMEAW